LTAEEEVGLLLPCNVVVYEKDNGTVVAAFDPMVMTKLSDNPVLLKIAEQVKERLQRVLNNL